MFPIHTPNPELRNGLTRREALKLSAAGVAAFSASGWLPGLAARAAGEKKVGGKTKRCILLWMNGGPGQGHTFDPKPGLAKGITPIDSAVPGIQVSDQLPLVAKRANELALIRSMSTYENNHRQARVLMRTGYAEGDGIAHPVFGAVASKEIGDPAADLPSFVAINGGRPGGSDNGACSYSPGFLGPVHAPLMIKSPAVGLENLQPADGRPAFDRRAALLEEADAETARRLGTEAATAHREAYTRALRLVRSPKAAALDLSKETDKTRERYGKTSFGDGCLMARRLVEAGVPFVEVQLGGWDHHNGAPADFARHNGWLDPAFAALLDDLKASGLLADTLVVWMGEFGRTPGANNNHYAKCWTTALAGAGLKVGQAVGKSSADGKEPAERPVSAADFMATICKALGIDATKTYPTGTGRKAKVVDKDAAVIDELFA